MFFAQSHKVVWSRVGHIKSRTLSFSLCDVSNKSRDDHVVFPSLSRRAFKKERGRKRRKRRNIPLGLGSRVTTWPHSLNIPSTWSRLSPPPPSTRSTCDKSAASNNNDDDNKNDTFRGKGPSRGISRVHYPFHPSRSQISMPLKVIRETHVSM